MDFGPDDLVLFGVPVYGGRIPSPAVQTLRRMQGSRTPAVLVAAYGTALVPMSPTCWQDKCRVSPLSKIPVSQELMPEYCVYVV